VRPEFPVQSGRPDYALLHEGRPLIMVEAKPLGSNLEKARDDGFRYCWKEKVPYFVLTDGDKWEIWDLSVMGGKEITTLSLSSENPGEAARKLLALWRPAMPSIKVAPEQVVPLPPSKPPTPPSVTLEELEGQVKPKAKPPKAVILPDGTRRETKFWNSLLIAVAEWAVPRIPREKIPIRVGTERYLVHFKAVHPSGKNFFGPRRIGDVFLETNFSASSCVRFSCRLLREAGTSPSKVKVEGWEPLEEG